MQRVCMQRQHCMQATHDCRHTHTHACKAFHCAQVFDILINNSLPIHPWVRNSFGASHLREVAWSAQTRSCSISGGDDHSGHQSRSRGLS